MNKPIVAGWCLLTLSLWVGGDVKTLASSPPAVDSSCLAAITHTIYSGRPSPGWHVREESDVNTLRYYLEGLELLDGNPPISGWGGYILGFMGEGCGPSYIRVHEGYVQVDQKTYRDSKGLQAYLDAERLRRGLTDKEIPLPNQVSP